VAGIAHDFSSRTPPTTNPPPGSDWSEAIIDAIENARVMVLVFSARANASRQRTGSPLRAPGDGLVASEHERFRDAD
jgi:hypothetical protein